MSGNPDTAILGLYALPVFIVLVVYGSFFFVWLAAFSIPQSRELATAILGFVQHRWWLSLLLLCALCVILWSLFAWPEWLEYPLLSMVVLVGSVWMGGVLIMHGWRANAGAQAWRKVAVVLVALLLIVEGGAQIAALLGQVPGNHQLDGAYAPQGRIYQDVEGLGNGQANAYGWYYPEFELAQDSRRILVLGDSFVQALQIDSEAHMGLQLQSLINDTASESQPQTEVLALGYPGFGPGLYLNIEMLAYAIEAFDPDEVVALIHLGNDLVNSTAPSETGISFAIGEGGNVEISPESFTLWHNVAHYTITGYEPYSPLRTIDSYILTPKLVADATRGQPLTAMGTTVDPYDIPGVQGRVTRFGARRGDHTVIESIALDSVPGRSNFLFEKGGDPEADVATAITTALIDTFYDFTRAKGIDFHLVTIPVFPAAFYTEFQGVDWTPEVSDYDLFLPEKRLTQFVLEEGVPFLASGQALLAGGLGTAQIQSHYFTGGTGHLTPEGHAYMAQTIFNCFYASDSLPESKPDELQGTYCFGN